VAAWINCDASDHEILEFVFEWIEALSRKEYGGVAMELGYWNLDVRAAPEAIRRAIEGYRSSELFPGVEHFAVSDWRLAVGSHHVPRRDVVWYKENAVGIVASVCVDLPLNGAWSDLSAEFLLFERGDHPGQYQLRLEEISHPVRDCDAEEARE